MDPILWHMSPYSKARKKKVQSAIYIYFLTFVGQMIAKIRVNAVLATLCHWELKPMVVFKYGVIIKRQCGKVNYHCHENF